MAEGPQIWAAGHDARQGESLTLACWGTPRLSGEQWNFEKFLIDKEGNVVQRWASTTTPDAIDAEVAKLV